MNADLTRPGAHQAASYTSVLCPQVKIRRSSEVMRRRNGRARPIFYNVDTVVEIAHPFIGLRQKKNLHSGRKTYATGAVECSG